MEAQRSNHYSRKVLLTYLILVIDLNKTLDKKGKKWINLTVLIWNILYKLTQLQKQIWLQNTEPKRSSSLCSKIQTASFVHLQKNEAQLRLASCDRQNQLIY